jgi:hypothetical protein
MMDGIEQRAIKWARFDKHLSLVCLRKQASGWFECDVLGVTKARYWHEIEIKTSRGDFRRDFEKNFWGGLKKHDIMRLVLEKKMPVFDPSDRYSYRMSIRNWERKNVPNYFWFMVPDALADQIIAVPEHAGLLVVKRDWIKVAKKAPLLHKNKATDAFISSIVSAFEYRFYALMEMVDDLHKEIKRLKNGQEEEKEGIEARLYKALDCAEEESRVDEENVGRFDGGDEGEDEGTVVEGDADEVEGSAPASATSEADGAAEEEGGGGTAAVEDAHRRASAEDSACKETGGQGPDFEGP